MTLSSAAESNREAHRKGDGKFGEQAHSEPDLELGAPGGPAHLLGGFTADQVEARMQDEWHQDQCACNLVNDECLTDGRNWRGRAGIPNVHAVFETIHEMEAEQEKTDSAEAAFARLAAAGVELEKKIAVDSAAALAERAREFFPTSRYVAVEMDPQQFFSPEAFAVLDAGRQELATSTRAFGPVRDAWDKFEAVGDEEFGNDITSIAYGIEKHHGVLDGAIAEAPELRGRNDPDTHRAFLIDLDKLPSPSWAS